MVSGAKKPVTFTNNRCSLCEPRKESAMKDHSTMTTIEFLFSIAWKFVIGFIWYKNLLFRVMPKYDVYESLRMLLIMVSISVCFFLFVLWHRKNGWTATACFVFPFGIYTLMTYTTTSALLIRIVMSISLVLSVAYSTFLLSRRINHKSVMARRKIARNRIFRCIYSVSCIITVAMLSIMVGIGWKGYLGTGLVSSVIDAESIHQEIKEEDTIEANMDMVLKLQPAIWEKLNTRERIDVLQIVCNIEAHYLGLNHSVVVQGDNLSPYTLGAYSDGLKLIRINLNHIENDPVEEVLSTLLHEIHHSYEHRLAEAFDNTAPEYRNLRVYRDAAYYSTEVDDYVNPRDDYYGYMTQHLEMDSEIYAEYGVQEYYTRIEKWNAELIE